MTDRSLRSRRRPTRPTAPRGMFPPTDRGASRRGRPGSDAAWLGGPGHGPSAPPSEAAATVAAVLEEAFALWRELSAAPSTATGGSDQRTAPGRERAGRLLRAAEACHGALGGTPAPAPSNRPATGAAATRPDPEPALTPRELEVLAFLAKGWTDREIAEALFVSRRTVTSHVTNILTKLDAHSRTGAVARAVRDGIV